MSLYKDQKKYQELAAKWLDNTITPEEELELLNWYNHGQDEPVEIPESFVSDEKSHHDRVFAGIQECIGQSGTVRRLHAVKRWGIAASVIFILFISGIYFLTNRSGRDENVTKQMRTINRHDVKPGGNKAILTLADGSQVVLDDVSDGVVATQEKATISKSKTGQLIYDLRGKPLSGTDIHAYNTITTPRGGQYQVILPDGTKVWLNAASSLKFPVVFSGKERGVKLTGEAYFEVAKDKNKPFTVSVEDLQVRVLGTHFNVMAYSDEQAITTTLLEGKVRVRNRQGDQELKPGEQAVATGSGAIRVTVADMEQAVAWKNGYFKFERADIETIMRQLARWYDVDIVYEGEVSRDEFVGKISRNVNISQVLRILELSKIHFRIEKDKKIVVMP